jgi:hypothetical protein
MKQNDPTGYSIVVIHSRFFKRELLGDDVREFDIATAQVLGTPSASAETAMSVMKRSRLQKWGVTEDWAGALDIVKKRGSDLTSGGTAPGDSGGADIVFLSALGAPVKPVYGYGGSAEVDAAWDRGELDIRGCGEAVAKSLFPEWISEKQCVPLYRYGADPKDDPGWGEYMKELGASTDIPHLFDIWPTTEGQKAVFHLTETANDVLSRVFTLPPSVPEDVVATWRKAFHDTVKDPAFIQSAEMLGRAVQYGSPESMISSIEAGRKAIEDPENKALFALLSGAAT